MVERETVKMTNGSGEIYEEFLTRNGAMGCKTGKLVIIVVAMVVWLMWCACLRVRGEHDCPEKRK